MILKICSVLVCYLWLTVLLASWEAVWAGLWRVPLHATSAQTLAPKTQYGSSNEKWYFDLNFDQQEEAEILRSSLLTTFFLTLTLIIKTVQKHLHNQRCLWEKKISIQEKTLLDCFSSVFGPIPVTNRTYLWKVRRTQTVSRSLWPWRAALSPSWLERFPSLSARS